MLTIATAVIIACLAVQAAARDEHAQFSQLFADRPSVSIFVAEAVPDVTSSVLNVSVAACKMGPMNHLFDMEVHLHELLLRSSARVDTPEKADFIYIPVYANKYACSRTIATGEPYSLSMYREAFSIAARHLDKNLWRRRGGRDHIFAITHGFAYEALEGNVLPPGDPVLLLSHGNRRLGYNPRRHIIIPPSLTGHARQALGARASPMRPLLAAFKGVIRPYWHHSFGVRQLLFELYGQSGDILIENDRDSDFERALGATFCLCPPGFYLWTPRPVESLFYGCVPVIIGDDVVPPFHELVPWDHMAVRVDLRDVPRLRELLMAVPRDAVDRAVRLGALYAPAFAFLNSYEERKGDVTHLLLIALQNINSMQ